MNFCSKCGAAMNEGASFCPKCGASKATTPRPDFGAPAPTPSPSFQPNFQSRVPAPSNELTGPAKILSLISMICGLVSLVSCMGGFAPGIAALVLANIASNKAPGVPNSKTKVGRITGIIGIVLSAISIVIYAIYYAVLMSGAMYY